MASACYKTIDTGCMHDTVYLSVAHVTSLSTTGIGTSTISKYTLLSDVILRCTTFSQPILPPVAPIMRPDSLLRLWRYINPSLTYLLKGSTLAQRCWPDPIQTMHPGVQMSAQHGSWIPGRGLPTCLQHRRTPASTICSLWPAWRVPQVRLSVNIRMMCFLSCWTIYMERCSCLSQEQYTVSV